MYDYSIQINCVRGMLDDGGSNVRRIKNKINDLEDDLISAIKADTMRISSGSLDKYELIDPSNDGNISSADNNLYHELDELRAAIIEEEMEKLQESIDL